MQTLAIVVGLLLLMTLASTALKRFDWPRPTVMVLVGPAVGFVPGLPAIALPAELMLLLFLPPLLYSHAWYVNWPEFSCNLPGIASLAVFRDHAAHSAQRLRGRRWVHLSGMLAVVVAGLYIGNTSCSSSRPRRRQAVTFWNVRRSS